MKLLALDTSSVACSVALQTDDALLERHEEQAREHSRLLLPMIRSLLDETGIRLPELDAIVLGNGPGSFIGMRIAASVVQGIAYAAELRVVPISSLSAVAAEVFSRDAADEVVVTQDAHMNEVYLAAYRRGAANLADALFEERLHGQGEITELDPTGSVARIAAGAGWQRYPALLEANRARIGGVSDIHNPRARHLLPPGAAALQRGTALAPAEISPAYLRQQVARTSD